MLNKFVCFVENINKLFLYHSFHLNTCCSGGGWGKDELQQEKMVHLATERRLDGLDTRSFLSSSPQKEQQAHAFKFTF